MASFMASVHPSVRHEDAKILRTPPLICGNNGPLAPAGFAKTARACPSSRLALPGRINGTCHIASKLLNDNGAKIQALPSLAAAWDTANTASVASTCTADVVSEVGRTPLWLAGGADGAANPESGAAGIAGCPVLSRLDASRARSMAEAGWLIAGAAATTLVRKSNWLIANHDLSPPVPAESFVMLRGLPDRRVSKPGGECQGHRAGLAGYLPQ